MTALPDPAKVLQALGDATRRAIVDRLSLGPTSVSRLAEPLGVTVTAVSQHLQVLEDCGLAKTEKVGRVRVCSLATGGLDALDAWSRDKRSHLERSLDALGAILDEED